MEMTESILTSIKKLLGIDESYKHFDPDLIMHINSVFSILTQLGVGPPNGFSITGDTEKWDSFIRRSAPLLLSPSINRSVSLSGGLMLQLNRIDEFSREEETQNGTLPSWY